MSNDGFIDKAGDAARKAFGSGEQGGSYAAEQPRKVVDYPMGGEAAAAGSVSHYGTQGGQETRIGGDVTSDRARYDDDPHYQEARATHLGAFDRDYDEYRREHGPDGDFGTWRTMRSGQREAMAAVREHMEVVGNDGVHVGTVDKVRGDQIILTRKDSAAGGVHHAIPVSWIQGIGEKLMLNIHGDDARRRWSEAQSSKDAAANLALGESPSQGSDGPHILDRSFSGTYDKD